MKKFAHWPTLALIFGFSLSAQANSVYENYTFATFAGPGEAGIGWHDGEARNARFNFPAQVAVDLAGNLYVADILNHTIRKMSPGGFVSTLAGLAGVSGTNDGFGAAARFNSPQGIAVDGSGTVYVADSYNHTIRQISPSGQVTTLAGTGGKSGGGDGVGAAARFKYPACLAIDTAGNIYVADSGNHTIRKIAPGAVVTTFAGKAGYSGSANGTKSAARFDNPLGVAVDSRGYVFVGDSYNDCIRQITPAGVVTTLAGKAGSTGHKDGVGSGASFYNPCGLAIATNGDIYVADAYNQTIRKIAAGAVVTTFAGTATVPGSTDGTNSAALFQTPVGLALDAQGILFVGDTYNHILRKIQPDGVVTTIAGVANDAGAKDATGSAARFNFPFGVALDSTGTAYITDSYSHTIRKVSPAGVVSTLAGSTGVAGTNDGVGTAAKFNYPFDLAVDPGGTVYVADSYNYTIRKIAPDGTVTTLAGIPGTSGFADGAAASAKFKLPIGIALDSATNVYVADSQNHVIRKITPDGVVDTFVGNPGISGSDDATGNFATFNQPYGVTVDPSGNLFVADTLNNTIRKITPGAVVTTVAGKAGSAGSADGAASLARFNNPRRLTSDGTNLFITEGDSSLIRKLSAAGLVTTLAGSLTNSGSADGTGSGARFNNPEGVAVDAHGNLYVADAGNHVLRKGCPVLPDTAVADVPLGAVRQLSVLNPTTTSWSWNFLRYPASSLTQLSATNTINPTVTLDVPDQFVLRFKGWDAQGHVALGTVSIGVDATAPILNISSPNNGLTELSWLTFPGRVYRLESSADLLAWTNASPFLSATTNGWQSWTVSVASPYQFYRVRANAAANSAQ